MPPRAPVFSVCLFKNCVLGTDFCTRCWVGERAQWSRIPNLLCHFNKLLSRARVHTPVLQGIRCFEEERQRFHILHGTLSLCHSVPPVRDSRKGIQAVDGAAAASQHSLLSPWMLYPKGIGLTSSFSVILSFLPPILLLLLELMLMDWERQH